MPDRETVIKGLQNLRDAIATDYIHEADQAVGTIDNALSLLKEQEAVEPSTYHHLFICPVCKTTLKREQKFCHECGRPVLWEGR